MEGFFDPRPLRARKPARRWSRRQTSCDSPYWLCVRALVANRPIPSYETRANRAIRDNFMSRRPFCVSRRTGNRWTFAQGFRAVVREAELGEPSPVRVAMVIKPWGYGVWE